MNSIKSIVLSCVLAVPAAAFLAGCHSDKDKEMIDKDSMTRRDMSSMTRQEMGAKGDEEIMQGQMMRDNAMKMSDGQMMNGMSKSDMMMKGDQMVKEGQMMKDKSTGM